MGRDRSFPIEPPVSGQSLIEYFASVHELHPSCPTPTADVTEAMTYYRDVLIAWDASRRQALARQRKCRQRQEIATRKTRQIGHRSGSSSHVSHDVSRDRSQKCHAEGSVTALDRSQDRDSSDVTPDGSDNVRELPITKPLTRSQQLAREAREKPRYHAYRTDLTAEQVKEELGGPLDHPWWEEPGFVGPCPTWYHPSGWVNGIVDPNWFDRPRPSHSVTLDQSSVVTSSVTPIPDDGGAPPCKGGEPSINHPGCHAAPVTQPTAADGGSDQNPDPRSGPVAQLRESTAKHHVQREVHDDGVSPETTVLSIVSRIPQQPQRDDPRPRRDAADIGAVIAELFSGLRQELFARIDRVNQRFDALALAVAGLLPAAEAEALLERVTSPPDVAPPDLLAASGVARARAADDPSLCDMPKTPDEKLIVKAWTVGNGEAQPAPRGASWLALFELYEMCKRYASCEDEALTLLISWAKNFRASITDPYEYADPKRLLMMPGLCPRALPEAEREPSSWVTREIVLRMWKVIFEAYRLETYGSSPAASTPSAPALLAEHEQERIAIAEEPTMGLSESGASAEIIGDPPSWTEAEFDESADDE